MSLPDLAIPPRWAAWLLTLVLSLTGAYPLTAAEPGPQVRTRSQVRSVHPVVKASAVNSVFLQGDFIELGIHSAGSFGAADLPPAGFHNAAGAQLGFLVDGDGWDLGAAPVVGDFFVPGNPEEVWGVTWTAGGQTVAWMNAGLEATYDSTVNLGMPPVPTDRGYPTDVSSGTDQRSVWRGTAQEVEFGQALTVTQTVSFSKTDKFFVVNVVMTNTGSATITGLKYMRSVDPDQDLLPSDNYSTENYVAYQPPRGSLPAFPLGNTDKALVIGRGPVSGVPLGLGTIDQRARVAYAADGQIALRDPLAVLQLGTDNTGSNVLADSARSGTPSLGDAAMALAFDLGDLAPNQSVSIDYAYILNEADLQVALGQLGMITILQPTTASGSGVPFQVTTSNPASATTKVDFYVAGMLVGTDTTAGTDGIFETTFDTLTLNDGGPLPNGPVTILAVATFADGTTSSKSKTVEVDNAGPPIAFGGATPANSAIVSGNAIPVEVDALDLQRPPFQVSIFREVGGVTTPLATLTQAPFVTTLDVSDLPDGTIVTIMAVASDQTNTARTTIYRAVEARLNPTGTITPVTAPLLPRSQGNETIYTAVSPSTPEGKINLLAALAGHASTEVRAFTWDATIASYVELPSVPTGGITVSTGIFIATRVDIVYQLDGAPSQTFALSIRHDGWTFAGIPPLPDPDNQGAYLTTFAWTGFTADYASSGTIDLAGAMGTPGGAPDSARPWFWNGSAYLQVDTLESGKGYWFKNNLPAEDISLAYTGIGTGTLRAVRATKSASTKDGTQVQLRDHGTPPPPPSGAATSASTGGGCGSGSGMASFALVLFLFSLRLLVARK